jgi:hypothetical protein
VNDQIRLFEQRGLQPTPVAAPSGSILPSGGRGSCLGQIQECSERISSHPVQSNSVSSGEVRRRNVEDIAVVGISCGARIVGVNSAVETAVPCRIGICMLNIARFPLDFADLPTDLIKRCEGIGRTVGIFSNKQHCQNRERTEK